MSDHNGKNQKRRDQTRGRSPPGLVGRMCQDIDNRVDNEQRSHSDGQPQQLSQRCLVYDRRRSTAARVVPVHETSIAEVRVR